MDNTNNQDFINFMEVVFSNLPKHVTGGQIAVLFATLLALYQYNRRDAVLVLAATLSKVDQANSVVDQTALGLSGDAV